MEEWLKVFQTLGVGGALAGMTFYFYRKDALEHAAIWRDVAGAMIQVVKENTVAMTANTKVIEALHRRDDRIEDILNELGYQIPHRVSVRKDPS